MSQSKITALTKFKEHSLNAINNYKTNKTYAMQELGRASHFLEDVNVPYHAANMIAVLSTHSQYESYVEKHQNEYATNTSTKYNNYDSESFTEYCSDILNDCAKNAYSYKDTVKKGKKAWSPVANNTVKYAQEYLAAFYYRFLKEVGEIK